MDVAFVALSGPPKCTNNGKHGTERVDLYYCLESVSRDHTHVIHVPKCGAKMIYFFTEVNIWMPFFAI